MSRVIQTPVGRVTIVAESVIPAAAIQCLTLDLDVGGDRVVCDGDSYRLDLALARRLPDTRLAFGRSAERGPGVPPGRLFLVPPGEPLHVRTGVGQTRALICRLSRSRTEEWLHEPVHWTGDRPADALDLADTATLALMEAIAAEVQQPGFASTILLEGMTVQLAVALERHLRHTDGDAATPSLTEQRLRAIDERLQDSLSTPTLAELAGISGLSVRHLSRAFRASRGTSLGAHVAQVRMQHAKRLLAEGQSVKAVAYRLAFGSPASFSYAFRRDVGLTPTAYQQRPQQAAAMAGVPTR